MTPAERLRSHVVLLITYGIVTLCAGLYALIGVLLIQDRDAALPGELYLAAGLFGGALVTYLSNSKGQETGPSGTPSDPVTVEAFEDDEPA